MPGSVTPRKGGGDGSGGNSPTGLGSKSPRTLKPLSKLPTKLSPRGEGTLSRSPESDPTWPQEYHAMPYTYPKFAASQAALPHTKKRVSIDKGSVKSDRSHPSTHRSWNDINSSNATAGLPANVAAALAAGNTTDALYRLNLPHELAASYDKNLPSERAKALVVGSRGRLPPPSIPSDVKTSDLLAIVSVERSNAVQVAA